MSAAALYELFELDATIDKVKSRQNVLVRHVDSLTDDMKTTVQNVKRLYGAIVLMKANSLSQSAIYFAGECCFGDDNRFPEIFLWFG